MRTYATPDFNSFDAQIWQVARAASAAPTYFLLMKIKGIKYVDAGTGWNNPTLEAIDEADYIWPGRLIVCLTSVGTGLEDTIQLTYEPKAPSIPSVLDSLFRKLTPRQAFEIVVAQYCVSCVTSCGRTHVQIASDLGRFGFGGPWQYVRLNVPQGMSKIGLDEWKKFTMIVALTEDYMEEIDVREVKMQIAARLSSPANYTNPASDSAVSERVMARNMRYAAAQRQLESQKTFQP